MKKIFSVLLLAGAGFSIAHAQVDIQANGSLNYTTILNNGATTSKYDIVFIGDGFTTSEQALFNQKVDEAVEALRNLPPYRDAMCSFNVWRVNVISQESGVDKPAQGITRNTALDCRYGNPPAEAERCIRSDSPAKCYEAAGYAPAYDAVFVLVNDTQWGGCAGGLVFSSISPNFQQIITHELGHKVGGLADEYDCYVCDGSDSGRNYTFGEPSEANLTANTNRTTTKWADLILPTTPIPTTTGPAGTVGLWAGGGYYATGIFRPQQSCQMRTASQPFCAVCNREMYRIMSERCTLCELNPFSIICYIRRDLFEFPWRERIRWPIPWPWPPCLSCPFDLDRVRYEIRFDEKILAGSTLLVKDKTGKILARGAVGKNGEPLVVTFEGNRFTAYDIEFESGQPQADKITLRPKITANPK